MARINFSSVKSFVGQHKKGLGIGGGLGVGVIALFAVGFLVLLPLKLIHIKEVLQDKFEARHQRAMIKRMSNQWRLVVDKEGKIQGYKQRVTGPNGSIRNLLANYRTDKLVSDLKAHGLEPQFDGSGKLISLKDGDNILKVDDLSLSDRRSVVRERLSSIYPELGGWRLGTRARRVYGFYGIKFRLFENTRERAADTEAKLREKLRQKIRSALGGPKGSVTSTSGDDPNEKGITDEERQARLNEQQTASEFGEKINTEADKLRAEWDAGKKVNLDIEDATKAAAKGAVSGGLKGVILGTISKLGDLCMIRQLLLAIELGAKALRAAPLARWAGLVFGAADDMKAGKVKDARQINTFMKNFNGFEQAGSWKRITGVNPKANIENAAKYKINGGLVGPLGDLNKAVEAKGVTNKTCGIVTNGFVQAGGAVISLGVAIFTGGLSKLAEAGIGAGIGLIQGLAVAVAEPVAIHMLAGLTLTGDESPEQFGDALVAGTDVLSNSMARSSGEPRISDQVAANLDSQAVAEKNADFKHSGLANRLFNWDDYRSFTGRAITFIPTTPDGAVSDFRAALASINPFNDRFAGLLEQFASAITGKANAAEETEDIFGVEQYGFTDEQLDQNTDLLANEEYIIDNPERKQAYEDYVKKCLEPESRLEDLDSDSCQSPDEEQMRYRLYFFDLSLMDNLASYVNRGDSAAAPAQ